MSNPADKIEPSEYSPKSARYINRQGNTDPAAGELPRVGSRPSDKKLANLVQSLEPAISRFRPWRPGWLFTIGGLIIAVEIGAAIGIYFADGTTWRKIVGFGTNTTELAPKHDTLKPLPQVSSPASVSIASPSPPPTTTALPASDSSTALIAPQPPNGAAPAPGISMATAAPQPNGAPPAPAVPVATVAPQSPNEPPSRVASVGGANESAPAVRGVTNSEVRFGISAPFTGAAKELGNQMRLGIETAFKLANEADGINGRQVKLVVADDGYEPTRTADTMKQLFEKQQVFGFVGNVGTPTAVVALPYALQNHALFFGAFTGADLLRRDPPDRYVFNYRASYAEETDAVVRYLVNMRHLRPDQIAVFAQHDAFGDAGFAGVAKAMRALRGDDSAIFRLDYERNTVDVDNAVARLRAHKTPIKAVVMVAAYRAAAKFIEKTRDLYASMIYTNVSFVGSTALASELMLLGPRFANGVIVTQVVPAVDGYSSAILKYKTALAKYFPGEAPDYVSLEGYVDGTVLLEGLKRAGPKPDTETLVDALENLRNFDIGLGAPISFSQSDHQGSHKIWATQLDDHGHYQPIDLE
jgi:ABC-type branched-subunit amino acid transport system substrate-binding protein